jgi:hypothetical protein
MGVIEILTLICATLKLLGLTTIPWFWILLPEGIIFALYIIFFFCSLRFTK